jgi:Protein of unknown function (DUF2809)
MIIKRRIIYVLLFVFCVWLALATRKYPEWFYPLIARYGGDTIWSGEFLFFLRILFPQTKLFKLAVFNYLFGVIVEVSQLWYRSWLDATRHTQIGRLMLGVGFLWSDLLCYAVGALLACGIAILIDEYTRKV